MPGHRGRKDSALPISLFLTALAVLLRSVAGLGGNAAPGIDPALLAQVVANQQAAMKRLEEYCYRQTILEEKLNNQGGVVWGEQRDEVVCHCDGVPLYKQLVINGRPTGQRETDPWPVIRDDQNWQKQVRRAAEKSQRYAQIIAEVPKAFEFTLLGEEHFEERPAQVYQLTPKPGYRPISRPTEMLRHVSGRAWIDPASATLLRLVAQVQSDFDMWGGLVLKVRKGGAYEMRQRAVNGAWLPYYTEERWHARIALIKHLAQHVRLERSDFRREALTATRR